MGGHSEEDLRKMYDYVRGYQFHEEGTPGGN